MFRGFVANAREVVFLPPLDGEQLTWAEALNDRGIAVGFSTGVDQRAVYWTGGAAVLISLPRGPSSFAEDINNVNQICGWMGIDPYPSFGATPFIWRDGKTVALPLPPYALAHSGTATALNNLGDACGYFFVADPQTQQPRRRACAWIDGAFIDLGVIPGATISHALDISDAREIVGYCEGPGTASDRAFLWRDGAMTDLSVLVPPGGIIPTSAAAINNSGQIAGGALLLPDNDGVAFRLTPALPAIPGNTNCDDQVNADDLINVILHWNADGPVGGRPADVNRDNRIDMDDLLAVLLNWSRPA
jgi:probable HAF family extracellular repeat protein